ncbi:hypothetical protein ACWCSD_26540 [Nonomuraea sp. NPDC001684]
MSLIRVITAAAELLDKTSRMRPGRSWDDPALEQALRQVRAGRLEPGLELVRQARDDHEVRALRVEQLGIAARAHTEALLRLAGDDPDALLWLGAARIRQAWAIRGGAYATHVGDQRFARFHEVLADAAVPLRQAAEARPDDPVPWERLQWHALGAQAGRQELDRLWTELTARAPHLYLGHYTRVQVLCGKWYGSDDEVLAFARRTADAAPPGDPVTATLALAHFEVAWGRIGESERTAREILEGYFGDPEVAGPLVAASDKWREGARPHPRALDAAHLFGAALYHGGHLTGAQRLLEGLGRRMPENQPWAVGSLLPGRHYARVRRDLGLA